MAHDPLNAETEERSGAFFGRRKGHKLRAKQADLMTELLPRLRINPLGDLSSAALFAKPVREVWLEIGFGGGEHLLAQARAHPDVGFIGCEPFVNGMAKLLTAISDENLINIRLYDGDALEILRPLPPQSLSRIFLLYPDPWPKRRHNKRRFVSDETLDLFSRVLMPDGIFRFASDIDHYIGWTLARVLASPDLTWKAERPDDWRQPWSDWPGTRYEAKAKREGRVPTYLTMIRR